MSASRTSARSRLELLNQFSHLLLEAETESDVAWSIAKQAIAHLGFEDCVVYLKSPDSTDLVQAAAHGPKNPVAFDIKNPIVIPMGKGIVGSVASSREVQRVDDTSSDPRYILDDEPRASELAVPMIHRGECLGVVDSEDHRKGFYTDDHQSVLETVAALGAARISYIRGMRTLEQSRSEYRQLVEHASDIVFRADKRGRFTYVNPVAVHLTGYTEKELLSMQFTDLVANHHQRRVKRFYREQVHDRRQSTYLEFQFKAKNNDLSWVGQSLQLIEDKGEVIGFQAIARDITTLKLAQSAVNRSQAIQSAMLDGALDAIISVDETGHVIEFNPAAERTFGYTMEEAFGRLLSDLIIPPELREAHRQGMNRLLATGKPKLIGQRIEVPALHKDGHQFPIELTLTQIKTADGQQFTAFARDITEQKESQEALEAARKEAENYAAAQTRFLSSMSHEIRTPLNAVIGISHLLQRTELSVKQQKYIHDIQRAGDVLLGLINNILDFQKIESGFMELEEVTFDLHDVLGEVIDRARYLASDKPVKISLERSEEVPQWVKSDPVRLTQILTNLLNNAVKFTSKGQVVLTVRHTPIDEASCSVAFEVRDTGVGIPEDALEKVFDTFTQASSDTTRRYGGSGLGLPIVRQLVRAFDGEIHLSSKEGEGSVFTVELPLKPSDDVQARTQSRSSNDLTLGGLRVLVVEDNPVNQFVAREMLENWNAFVVIASAGAEALDILKDRSFDVVLMDIQMPEMDGFETTRRIRKDLGISSVQLPVIALTASALREQRDRAYDAGMNDFVMKPFDPVHLHDRIMRMVRAGEEMAEPTPPQEGSLTDWTFFEENYGDSPALKERIVGILREQLPGQRTSLSEAVDEDDASGVRFIAHKLLPSLRMVGAHALESICQAIGEEPPDEEVLVMGASLLEPLDRLYIELNPSD